MDPAGHLRHKVLPCSRRLCLIRSCCSRRTAAHTCRLHSWTRSCPQVWSRHSPHRTLGLLPLACHTCCYHHSSRPRPHMCCHTRPCLLHTAQLCSCILVNMASTTGWVTTCHSSKRAVTEASRFESRQRQGPKAHTNICVRSSYLHMMIHIHQKKSHSSRHTCSLHTTDCMSQA